MFGGFNPNSYLCIDFRAEIITASHNRQKHTELNKYNIKK